MTDTPDLRTLAAEPLARMFHEAYERLAPSFGYATREASAKPWDEVPENNRALMTAVCSEILAAVLPAHRRQVLAEAVREVRHHADSVPWSDPTLRRGIQYAAATVAVLARGPASAAPETAPRPRQDDETAPAVPEATPGPAEGAVVIEHAQLMSGGGMHVRPNDPEIERIFPLEQWITAGQRGGGRVFRRTVIVVDGWTEVTAPQGAGATPADGQDGDGDGVPTRFVQAPDDGDRESW